MATPSGAATKKTTSQNGVARARPRARKATGTKPLAFKLRDYVIYPTHGVGRVVDIQKTTIDESPLQLFVVDFDHDRMRLSIPVKNVKMTGMRKVAGPALLRNALQVLRGQARVKRTMWSRRAQEYESKINSGDLIQLSEVVRDLYRSREQPEPSYSERQLFEQALSRMAREVAVVQKSDHETASEKLISVMREARSRATQKRPSPHEATH